jgi:hypothetical protein
MRAREPTPLLLDEAEVQPASTFSRGKPESKPGLHPTSRRLREKFRASILSAARMGRNLTPDIQGSMNFDTRRKINFQLSSRNQP